MCVCVHVPCVCARVCAHVCARVCVHAANLLVVGLAIHHRESALCGEANNSSPTPDVGALPCNRAFDTH